MKPLPIYQINPGIAKALLLAAGLAFASTACAKTILFVDDEDVLYRPGTLRQVVVFEKYAGNPVIPPTKPWEGMIGWSSFYRDPETGKYQAWYQAYQQTRPEDKSLRCVVAYAESEDGLTWVKPDLGLFSFYEIEQTNIVLVGAGNDAYGDRYGCSVFVDDHDPDPGHRYKMLHYDWETGDKADLGAGIQLAYSPDGIHWTKYAGGMVSKTAYGGKHLQPPFEDESILLEEQMKDGSVRKSWRVPHSMSDALDVIYDTRLDSYVIYGKMWFPGPDGGLIWKHGMGRMESKDFIHWSKPELVLTVGDSDPAHLEFHTSPVFFYNGMYLSLNQVLDRGAGTIDVEFMCSRDGRHWDRTFARIPVIPRVPGTFEAGSILTNGTPVVLDDEIRFYYGAYRGPATGGVDLDKQVTGSDDYFSGIGLATTPKDRFVAVVINPETPVKGQKKNAPKKVNTIGNVTLKPMDLSGLKEVTLNADSGEGSLQMEILNEDGYRLHGFTREDSLTVTGDGIALKAGWREKSLSDLPPGRYLVRVYLDQAKLYAINLN